MKQRIRINESQLHKIVSESVKNVLKESVIRAQFNNGRDPYAGSFEIAIDKAWNAASNSNKKRLEDAFPELFNKESMYGTKEDSFDFRSFPTEKDYNDYYSDWQKRNSKI